MAVNVGDVQKQVNDAKQKAEAIGSWGMDRLREHGIAGFVVLKSGLKPDQLLNEAVVENDVHQVFVGTRDLGSVHRALVGSVSTDVVRHCPVPVTVVKHH